MSNLQHYDFGLKEYHWVWQLQKQLLEQRCRGEIPDVLLTGEHPPVITLGRGTQAENLLNPQIPVIEIERGGDATYHGPGQLIAYPLLQLPSHKHDLHRYLRELEQVLILTLATFGVEGHRKSGWTGVWVNDPFWGEKKIASIGVAVRKWVTYHGIALNINTDLTNFKQINPCGLDSQVMISLATLLGEPQEMRLVKERFATQFTQVFEATLIPGWPALCPAV